MCQFCVQHGDGKQWYLNAANYVADLESDLERRDYIINFVQGFDTMRGRSLTWLNLLESATPLPIERAVKKQIHKRQQVHHFGQPVPIEECERIFDFATQIVRMPCVCRTFAGKSERAYCLAVTALPMDDTLAEAFKGFDGGPDNNGLERLTKEQAMELLHACEREGLMHSVWTFITPFIGAICNCNLDSGCMAMTISLTHETPIMWRGEYVIDLSAEECISCGACVKRCPFSAIDAPPAKGAPVNIRLEDCYGCGVCRSACPTGALGLVPRTGVPAVAGLW